MGRKRVTETLKGVVVVVRGEHTLRQKDKVVLAGEWPSQV